MAKARQAANARSESQYVVVPTSAGPVLGQVVQESATGVVTLRAPDGSTVECVVDGRIAPSADPGVFGHVPFMAPEAEDLARRLEALLALYRDELKTVEERWAWATAHGGGDLPRSREVDELLKYRYEQHRADWSASLRILLSDAVKAGNERVLLDALDQSVPTDARRVAAGVAVEQRVTAAIPSLSAAAIHKTQGAFARDAVRALQAIAPERLPLIRRAAQRDVADVIDARHVETMREAEFLSRSVAGEGVAELPATGVRDEVLLHLALALPTADQVRFLSNSGKSAAIEAVRHALRNAYRAVEDKESPTGYELLLRTALAQLILADDSGAALAELRAAAARTLVRYAELEQLQSLVTDLPDTAATFLVRTGMSAGRSERSKALLASVSRQRPALAAKLAPAVRAALSNGELGPSARATALALLAADADSHEFVSREVGRELGREASADAEELTLAIVRHEVPLVAVRLRAAGRAELLRALPAGSSQYAATVLRALREEADSDGVWPVINSVAIPETWVTEDPGFRAALLEWLDATSAISASPPIRAAFVAGLEADAPAEWTSWPPARQHAALTLLAAAPAAKSAPLVAATAANLAPGDRRRAELLAFLAGSIIANTPEALQLVTALLPEEELRTALLEQGAELESRIADREHSERTRRSSAGRQLAADLQSELDRSLHALGRDDQLGVLFARLAEEIASLSPQEAESEPEVARYREEFPASAEGGTSEQRGDALIAALRRLGGRSRSSQAALAFFRARAEALLQQLTTEELLEIARERRQLLDRLDSAAIEPLAAALLQGGSDPKFVVDLLGGDTDTRSLVNVAFRIGKSHPDAARGLLGRVGVGLRALADAVATRSAEWTEPPTGRQPGVGGAADFARRLAPTLEAIESLLLNYMRVRRVLMTHGLAPVEPVLGNLREARELLPGAHRVVGLSIAEGTYEVLSQGIRSVASGEVIVPAAVARRADEGRRVLGDPT